MSKRLWWILGIVVAFVLVVAAAGSYYAFHFKDRALPGASVAGQSVSGLSGEEIVDDTHSRFADAAITIVIGEERATAKLSELGYVLDAEETTAQVLAPNTSIVSRFSAAFSPRNIDPVYSVDEKQEETYIENLIEKYGEAKKDASVELSDGGNSFVVTPAVVGREIEGDTLKQTARAAALALEPATVELSLSEVQPEVSTQAAQQAADDANTVVGLDISITDGIDTHTPTEVEKASWVNISADKAEIDKDKVTAWVEAAALASNVEPTPGVRNVNSRGDVVSTVSEGGVGWKAKNAKEVADEVIHAMENREAYYGDFDYDKITSEQWDDRLIADGAENLAYQAAPGEKWIDIDLSNYTVSAYEGSTIVRGPVSMVPGAPVTPTVTGVYKTYLQFPTQTMRGLNADGSRYETPDVPWATYFHEGYALHGAYWRDSFGYGGEAGSHGCINMPVDEAKWFYDFAGIGTTVASHY